MGSKGHQEWCAPNHLPCNNVSSYITAPGAYNIAETVPGSSTERITKLTGKINLIIGFDLIERIGDKFYCSHVLVNSDGLIVVQREIHVSAHEGLFWLSGFSIDVFDVGEIRVGIKICRDSCFDEIARLLFSKRVELVLIPFTYNYVSLEQY